jgi:hypothetical protein
MLKYERIVKSKLGEKFHLKTYKQDFWRSMNIKEEDVNKDYINMKSIRYEELEKGLIKYIASL